MFSFCFSPVLYSSHRPLARLSLMKGGFSMTVYDVVKTYIDMFESDICNEISHLTSVDDLLQDELFEAVHSVAANLITAAEQLKQ
jgi:hypothetical protein